MSCSACRTAGSAWRNAPDTSLARLLGEVQADIAELPAKLRADETKLASSGGKIAISTIGCTVSDGYCVCNRTAATVTSGVMDFESPGVSSSFAAQLINGSGESAKQFEGFVVFFT